MWFLTAELLYMHMQPLEFMLWIDPQQMTAPLACSACKDAGRLMSAGIAGQRTHEDGVDPGRRARLCLHAWYVKQLWVCLAGCLADSVVAADITWDTTAATS